MSAVDLHPPKASTGGPAAAAGASRPGTQSSGYRFGQLSRSSFFARHNPHPHRCIHIKGLLGLPIPVVVDDCDHSSYETHLCFPPNGHNEQKLLSQRLLLPVNAIHLNSQQRPLDAINGLQYFTSLRNFSFKEKAVPRLGLVPVTENWREQLRTLTEQTFQPELLTMRREHTYPATAELHQLPVATPAAAAAAQQQPVSRPMYSQQTGRLIPPPSRAMSRRPLRSSSRRTPSSLTLAPYEHISAGPDLESAVFSMLCQILQTEDFNAVQAWLVSASEREKALVMDVIRSAVANKAAYYEADPTGEVFEPVNIREDLRLPPIAEAPGASPKRVDRLVIEDAGAEPCCSQEQQQQQEAKPAAGAKTAKQADSQENQPKQKQEAKPKKLAPAKAPKAPGEAKKKQKQPLSDAAKMKYSKHEPGLGGSDIKDVWRPQESYAD